jgi:hypothetical protein
VPTYDYYELLEVDRHASQAVIERAYRELSKRYHPDNGGNARIMQMLNEAFEVLSDPAQRAAYDASGEGADRYGASAPSAAPTSIEEFERLYDAAMKKRGSGVTPPSPENWSSIEWAKVPAEVWRPYVAWSKQPSFRNWRLFLGALVAWKDEAGPAVVGQGVLATRFDKARGLPGFDQAVEPLEASVPRPNGEFPDGLMKSYRHWLSVCEGAENPGHSFWAFNPKVKAFRDFLKRARFWALADPTNHLSPADASAALWDEFTKARAEDGFAELLEQLRSHY